MLRSLPILFVALVLAACGGDDATPSSTSAPLDTSEASSETTEPAAGPATPTPSLVCEDAPNPDDYIDGQIPPANRPCEIPTTLATYTVRDGVGRAAETGDTMIVDYIGIRSDDGIIFDESYSRGVPLDFPLGRGGVIKGWDEGLLGAQAGSLIKLDIPADLAYGDTPPGGEDGDIKPGDALTFIIEVRAVIASVTVDDAPLDLDIPESVGALEVTVTDLTVGDGATVELGKTAVVHMLLVRGDNKVVLFDTWERSDPLQIIMDEGQSLPGIFQGLQGARVGTIRTIAMPPEDAFGVDGETGLGLPAGVDLIAVVEVVGVY